MPADIGKKAGQLEVQSPRPPMAPKLSLKMGTSAHPRWAALL
jgi:hypothetical protein